MTDSHHAVLFSTHDTQDGVEPIKKTLSITQSPAKLGMNGPIAAFKRLSENNNTETNKLSFCHVLIGSIEEILHIV